MNEKISVLMDGEADERSAAQAMDALRDDPEALRTWRAYHLIGDAMRDTRPLSHAFAARVAERLAAEPTMLAPGRLQSARPRTWFALSAAASLAAVGLVGWMAFGPQATPVLQPQTAQAPAARQVAETPPPTRVPPPSATNDYLLAHQGYSPRAWLQGMAPYARTVSDSAQEGRR